MRGNRGAGGERARQTSIRVARRRPRRRGTLLTLAVALLTLVAGVLTAATAQASVTRVHVWRVGSWNGVAGNVGSLEEAVRKAAPGDWILIGPGDYHPRMDYRSGVTDEAGAGMLITKPGVHVRGMNRNTVIIDGTKPGSAPCSSNPADQDYGPVNANGQHLGRNGVEAEKVDGVTFDNLTVCNFLNGASSAGNEIWWNGGDDSGQIGMSSWYGSYLSATSTFYDPSNPDTAALYGIFTSNASGPGMLDQAYASNFSDSGIYVGACPDCNAVLDHVHAQYNALGYSGTNSGGRLLVQHSEWDHNKDGFNTNSQNSADAPSPQDGSCPAGVTGPTGTNSCWVFRYNYVHDNNNPNVPTSGEAAFGPVGSGVVIAGGRYDTVTNNVFVNNGSWGMLTTIFPDFDAGAPGNNCRGGSVNVSLFGALTVPCLYGVFGNEVANNVFKGNGYFGNPTNGDIADLSLPPGEAPGAPGDCFHGNKTDVGGPATTWPATLQTTQAVCGRPIYPDQVSDLVLTDQLLCNTQLLAPCPPSPGHNYPRQTAVYMHRLTKQATMPNPCADVPGNPWCTAPA